MVLYSRWLNIHSILVGTPTVQSHKTHVVTWLVWQFIPLMIIEIYSKNGTFVADINVVNSFIFISFLFSTYRCL